MQRSLSTSLNEGLRIQDPSALAASRGGDGDSVEDEDEEEDDEEIEDNKSDNDDDGDSNINRDGAQYSPRKAFADEVMSFAKSKTGLVNGGESAPAPAPRVTSMGKLLKTENVPSSLPATSASSADGTNASSSAADASSSWSAAAAEASNSNKGDAPLSSAPTNNGNTTSATNADSSASTAAGANASTASAISGGGATGSTSASDAEKKKSSDSDSMDISADKADQGDVVASNGTKSKPASAVKTEGAGSNGASGVEASESDGPSLLEQKCLELRKCVLDGDTDCVRATIASIDDSATREKVVNETRDGFSTLMAAVSCEKGKLDRDLVLELLRGGARVTPVDRVGNAALHWAALNGQLTVLDDLGANDVALLSLANNEGDTPLHLASRAGHAEVVKHLITRIVEKHAETVKTEAGVSGPSNTTSTTASSSSTRPALSILTPTGQKLPDALQKRKDAALALIPEQEIGEISPPPALVARNLEGETAFDAAGRDVSGRLNHDVRNKVQLEFWNTSKFFRTLVLHHPDCFDHVPVGDDDRDVWEAPERIAAILEELAGSESFSSVLISSKFPPAEREKITKVHEAKYVNMVYALSDELQGKNPVAFTPRVQSDVKKAKTKEVKRAEHSDTSFSAGSLSAALRASGAVCHAIDHVVDGKHRNAFCIVRPPGHHAGLEGLLDSASSCGFCIFNNVMVGAMHAMEKYPETIRKIAIVDFDVHHGNGTQEIVAKLNKSTMAAQRARGEKPNPPVLFFSSHVFDGARPNGAYEFYPGSGQHSDALGNIINAPMMPLWRRRGSRGSKQSASPEPEDPLAPKRGRRNWAQRFYFDHFGRTEFRRIVKERLLPPVRAFQPDLILISAGFDAGRRDVGNGRFMGHFCSGFDLQQQDFMWIAGQLSKVANICCKGRVVSVLEGGYGRIDKSIDARMMRVDRTSLARNVVAHLAGLVNPLAKMDADPDESDSEDEAAKEHEEKQLQRRGRNRKKPKRFENEVAPTKRRKRRGQGQDDDSDEEDADSATGKRRRKQAPYAPAAAPSAPAATANNAPGQEPSVEKREMALAFLRKVKTKFAHDDSVYRDFLVIMGHFKNRTLHVPQVIEQVKQIFNGDPELMREFNEFLPPGYNTTP